MTGGNQPNPNADVRVPTPMPPVRPTDLADADIATASRKGGPIQRFARGGIPMRPTMRFDGGGQAVYANTLPPAPAPTYNPQSPQYGSQAIQTEMSNLEWGPGGSDPYPAFAGAHVSTPAELSAWNAMTPAQQTWYGTAASDAYQDASEPMAVQQLIYNQLGPPPSSTPAPAPAAPAAPAPTPAPTPMPAPTVTSNTTAVTTDPNNTTGTGAPGLTSTVAPTATSGTGAIAKSYDPNVDAQTGASFTGTQNAGGTNYSVGTDDLLATNSAGTQILSRKGGPIRRYAQGGAIPSRPVMRFAAGGASPNPSNVTPSTWQEPAGDTQSRAAAWDTSSAYVGPTVAGGWSGTPYSQLAPNQQAWATQYGQQLAAGQLSPSIMPDAVWPTAAAPAAATPSTPQPAPTVTPTTAATTTDPNNTAGSGAPGLANNLAPATTTTPAATTAPVDPTVISTTGVPSASNPKNAKTYDPTLDYPVNTAGGSPYLSNVGGTNYGANPLGGAAFQKDNYGQIAGFKRGGIPQRPTLRVEKAVNRYDDGGGVSPSFIGMPPALGGGQQQIPPYYFNPATYSAAGAPVGKGVSQTSVPTYLAGAVPALPMFRGGVVKFADGGDVDATESQMQYATMQDDPRDAGLEDEIVHGDQSEKVSAPVISDNPPPGGSSGYFAPPDAGGQPAQQPAQQPSDGSGSAPNYPPYMPEISDGQGNPSKGFIGALTSGLHWLGEHLGLSQARAGEAPAPAIAQNPQTQTGRVNFTQGNLPDGTPAMTKAQWDELGDQVDPGHSLQPYVRNVAAMEYAWKALTYQGRDADASKLAASILHYSQSEFQSHSEQAAKLWYDGHPKEAVDEINEASDGLVDGRHIVASLDKNGQVVITGSDLSNRETWKQIAGPAAVMRFLNGASNGSMGWTAFESQAAKYDGTYHDMAKARAAAVKSRGEDAEAAAAAAKYATPPAATGPTASAPASTEPPPPVPAITSPPMTTASAEAPPAAATPPAIPNQPTPPAITPPTVSPAVSVAEADRGRPPADASGSAPMATRPADADTADAAPQSDQPAAQAQPVAAEVTFDQISAALDKQEATARQQLVTQGQAYFGKQLTPNPPLPTSKAERLVYDERMKQVNADNARVKDAMDRWIAAGQTQISDGIKAQRDAAMEKFKVKSAATLEGNRQADARTAATTANTRETGQKELQGRIERQNKMFGDNLTGVAALTPTAVQDLHDANGQPYNPLCQLSEIVLPRDWSCGRWPNRKLLYGQTWNRYEHAGYFRRLHGAMVLRTHPATRRQKKSPLQSKAS